MPYHIITPDESEGTPRRTAASFSPTGHEQRGISGGVIATGYLCGFASLFIFPPALALAGIVIGIVCLVRERLGHGIMLLIVSTMCGFIGMSVGTAVWMQVVNQWFSRPTVETQTEQQRTTYTVYTADDFYSMAMFGCRWNGHHYIPLPPADSSVPYPALRRTPDMTSLPEGLPVSVVGMVGGTADSLPNFFLGDLSDLNNNGHWNVSVYGSTNGATIVQCVLSGEDAASYNRAVEYAKIATVSGKYYKIGHSADMTLSTPVLYPCRIKRLLDYSGDEISR